MWNVKGSSNLDLPHQNFIGKDETVMMNNFDAAFRLLN